MKIDNPIGFKRQHISTVLAQLAAQENCDGEPYDQMILAAQYIVKLERRIEDLESGLESLIYIASQCDGWEQFPPNALEAAEKVLSK